MYFPCTKQQNLVWPFWITFKDPSKAIKFCKNWIKQFLLITVSKFKVIEGQYLQKSLLLTCRSPPHHGNLKSRTPSNDPQKHCWRSDFSKKSWVFFKNTLISFKNKVHFSVFRLSFFLNRVIFWNFELFLAWVFWWV